MKKEFKNSKNQVLMIEPRRLVATELHNRLGTIIGEEHVIMTD